MPRFRKLALLFFPSLLALPLALAVLLSAAIPVSAEDSAQAALPPRLASLLSVAGTANLLLQATSDPSKADDPLPEGKGKDITKKACSGCHALTVITQKRRSSEEWDSVLDNMISKGLNASDDDLATIHDYLVTYFGPAKEGVSDAPSGSSSPQQRTGTERTSVDGIACAHISRFNSVPYHP